MAKKKAPPLDWPNIGSWIDWGKRLGKTQGEIAKAMSEDGIKTSKGKKPTRIFVQNCINTLKKRKADAELIEGANARAMVSPITGLPFTEEEQSAPIVANSLESALAQAANDSDETVSVQDFLEQHALGTEPRELLITMVLASPSVSKANKLRCLDFLL